MKIDDWPMDRIMRLPDWCFGRRFDVSVELQVMAAVTVWDISELGFPERFVIWEVGIMWLYCDVGGLTIRLALGDQVPANAAQMTAYQALLPGVGAQGQDPRYMQGPQHMGMEKIILRTPFSSGGMRLVGEATGAADQACIARVHVVVSSMPTEVPDWLISGSGKNLL